MTLSACSKTHTSIQLAFPNSVIVLFLPPHVTLNQLQDFISDHNTWIGPMQGTNATLKHTKPSAQLITSANTVIHVHQAYPAHEQLAASDLAITTVGTITDELAKLGTPMIVLSPLMLFGAGLSRHYTPWDGLIGMLIRTPIIGLPLLKCICKKTYPPHRFTAWPNIKSNKEVVPEIREFIPPNQLAEYAIKLLNNDEKLTTIRENLKPLQTKAGAAQLILKHIKQLLYKDAVQTTSPE